MNATVLQPGTATLAEPHSAARWTAGVLAGYRVWLMICVGVFAVLLVWAAIWPYTGEGDSTLHFATARDANVHIWGMLHAWGRPVHKLFIILPSRFGIFPARVVQALITIALMWQTMRLAQELGFKKPWLAGLMLIWQPTVFCLASDTMTEIPFALGMVIAIRLWRARRLALSCLLVGFLPMVRPEGFFLGPLWGLMLLLPPSWFAKRDSEDEVKSVGENADSRRPSYAKATSTQVLEYGRKNRKKNVYLEYLSHASKRLLLGLPGVIGLICWSLACKIFKGGWFYFLDVWSWPVNSYDSYGSGSLFHHVYLWPDYCGPVLTVFFVVGIRPSLQRRGMALPWIIWSLVFVAHSVMFWAHKFAALGLMRIMASTSPVTALICLEGWLWCEQKLRGRKVLPARMKLIGLTTAAVACACVMIRYALEPEHYRCFPIRAVAQYAVSHDMVSGAPMLFSADKTFYAEVNLPGFCDRAIQTFDWDREKNVAWLAGLPPGSIGMWDNQSSEAWYHISISQLQDSGYEIIHEEQYILPAPTRLVARFLKFRNYDLRYVLLRKRAATTQAIAHSNF